MNSNWSYGPEMVKLGFDLCDLDFWPWPFAWTSCWSLVITPENFMMIQWWEHSEKGVTDRRTENTIHRAAWSQLKIELVSLTHWYLGDLDEILKMQFSILFYWLGSSAVITIMPYDECHRTLPMSQHWIRWWFGAVRQQTITSAYVDPDLCCLMAVHEIHFGDY